MPEFCVTIRQAVVRTAVLRIRARSMSEAGLKAKSVVRENDFGSPVSQVSTAGSFKYNETYDDHVTRQTPMFNLCARGAHHTDVAHRSLAAQLHARLRHPSIEWDDECGRLAHSINQRISWKDARTRRPD